MELAGAGSWQVAALLLDASGRPVGGLSAGFSVTLSGTTFPSAVRIDMLATAPDASQRIRVLRKQGVITGPTVPSLGGAGMALLATALLRTGFLGTGILGAGILGAGIAGRGARPPRRSP